MAYLSVKIPLVYHIHKKGAMINSAYEISPSSGYWGIGEIA